MIRVFSALPTLIGNVRRRAAVTVLLAAAQSIFLLPIALLVRRVFDQAIPSNDQLGVLIDGLLIALCYGASAVASIAIRAYAARVTKASVGVLRHNLVEKLCGLPMSWHDQHNAGAVHSIVIQDCERVDRMVNSLMSLALPGVLTGIGLAVVGTVLSPLLSVVLLIALPAMLLTGRRFARHFRTHLRSWHSAATTFSAHAQLLLSGISTIRTLGAEDREVARFDREIQSFVEAGCESSVAGARYSVLQGAVATVAGVAVLVVGGILVAQHTISVGSLIAFYAVVALILRQVSSVVAATPSIHEGAVALERVQQLILAEEPDAYQGVRQIDLRGAVDLRHVSFRYNGRAVLRDVSLEVAPGEQIVVTGPSGAGKTTLLAIMLGLYRPAQGSVLIDGVELTELDLPRLRRQIGVVLQDAAIFGGTIRENITIAVDDVSEDAVREAAQISGAMEFIRQLPHGLETRLGDRGIGLSGGQRQRIALARALVGRPRLLVLDEPTANLPSEMGAEVLRNLAELPWRPTILIISHDQAVVHGGRRVLRIQGGQIVADGVQAPVRLRPDSQLLV